MSAPIQRYNTFNGGMRNPEGDDGKWCLYADHERIVAALEAQVQSTQDLAADNFDVIQELRIQKNIIEAQVQTMREALERIKVETGTSTSAWHIAAAALAATEPKE